MSTSQKLRLLSDFEFLVKAIQGVVWEADPKTIRFTFVSDQAEQILGYPAEAWLEEDFWVDHLHPDDREAAIEACVEATSRGLHYEFEYRMIHADGRSIWFCESMFVDMQEGEPVRLHGILIDISNKMQMQCAIKESEQLLRLIATSAKDAIFRRQIHPVRRYEYVSPAVFEITGYSPEEFYSDPELGLKIIHPDDNGKQATLALVEPTGEPITLRIIRKDGGAGWVELRSVTIYDDTGRPLAVEGIARDVTERREVQEKLNQSQKMVTLGHLVSGVTHDFNNMLTVILGYAGLALLSAPVGDPIRDKLEAISNATERASQLTRQLLAFSRRQSVLPTTLDMNSVVKEMKGMLHRLIGEQVDMSFELGTDLGAIRADNGQIGQILLNLVVNARDAMPRGGSLVIRTSSYVTRYEVSFRRMKLQPGAYTVLSVTDTGTGIDPLARPRIFEPFFTTKPSGTGMGLTTVQNIVKQSNGAIAVESTVQGTTFRIFFPVTDEPIPFSTPRTIPIPRRSGETIMVVEDDDSVREVISGVLESAGYRVLPAKTGENAMLLFQSYSGFVDLVLIDMVLPDLDGRELGERLAALQRRTALAYMSGYSDDVHSRVEGSENLGFIQKPFTLTTLLERVRQLLDAVN